MRFFAGSLTDFFREVKRNNIAKRLEEAFLNAFRYRPSPSEVDSRKGLLLIFGRCLEDAELSEIGIFLEMQLPRTSCRYAQPQLGPLTHFLSFLHGTPTRQSIVVGPSNASVCIQANRKLAPWNPI